MNGRTGLMLRLALLALLLSACSRSLNRVPAAVNRSPAAPALAASQTALPPTVMGTARPTPITSQIPPTPLIAPSVSDGPYISVPVTGEAETVNLRGGPGASFPIVGKLSKGDTAPAVGRIGTDWIMIRYAQGPEGTAWVYAPLVVLSGEVTDLMTPAAP